MKNGCLPKVLGLVLLALVGWVVVAVVRQPDDAGGESRRREARAYPVEASPVVRGTLDERRVFSANLAASARLVLAPKVTGLITGIAVDIADPVRNGQVVVTLDDAEYRQAVVRAEADLAVARAQHTEATNRLDIAQRELDRVNILNQRGISSAAALDSARAEFLIRESAAQVSDAAVNASRAALETARIRLDYTRVAATWSDGDDTRLVAERFVDEGGTVAPNTPLLAIVEIEPLKAVFFVPERDYGRLSDGQPVTLTTDAWQGESFSASVERVAPVFREDSRQARVEVTVPNADHRLKPGMFVRATVTLDHVEDVITIPAAALARRGSDVGVFQIADGASTVNWIPVTVGLRDADRVQILSPELSGKVVVLGQNLLADGSAILLPGESPTP